MYRRCFIFIVFLLLAGKMIFAGNEGLFEIFTVSSPLLHINAMCQQDAFLWCGTDNGIVRFSIPEQTQQHFSAKDGLEGDQINAVLQGPDGHIIAGTESGLYVFTDTSWTPFPDNINGPGKNPILNMCFDKEKGLWVVTNTDVFRYNGQIWQHYEIDAQISLPKIVADEPDSVWINTNYQIYRLEEDRFIIEDMRYMTNPPFYKRGLGISADGRVWTNLYYDKEDGHPWRNAGLAMFNGESWYRYGNTRTSKMIISSVGKPWFFGRDEIQYMNKQQLVKHPVAPRIFRGYIREVAPGLNNTAWIATTEGMIVHIDAQSSSVFYNGIPATGNIYDIDTSRNNTLWIGTSRGVTAYDYLNDSWQIFSEIDGLHFNTVIAVATHPNGSVWCGAKDGISVFDGISWRKQETGNIYFSFASDIEISDDGTVWVVNTKRHIARYDSVTWKNYPLVGLNTGDAIYDIDIAADGSLWAGRLSNLVHIVDDIVHHIPLPTDHMVNSVYCEPDGSIWAGTTRGDIFRIIDDVVEELTVSEGEYTIINGRRTNCIHGFKTTCNGTTWIATDAGLLSYYGSTWTRYLVPDNNPSEIVEVMEIDKTGHLWLFTGDFFRFTPPKRTVISNQTGDSPETHPLVHIHPNPFNPVTTIRYELAKPAHVKFTIYSIAGQKISTLIDAPMITGIHELIFDGTGLASGVYVYRLKADGTVVNGKMLLAK